VTKPSATVTGLPQRFWLVLATFSLSLLLYVDRVCISAAKDPISQDLGLDEKQMGWVLSAFALGYALCQTPAGMMADRFGPRMILTSVVVFWSLFTGLTAAAGNYAMMLLVRLLFGAGEAGAFPGVSRAIFSWVPMRQRGIVQGINFSGARIGAAFALPAMAIAIDHLGWRASFVVLMLVGFVWAVFWYWWFRDDPESHPGIAAEELAQLREQRQAAASTTEPPIALFDLLRSSNVWLVSAQYFASNFTFYFCLSWMHPHLMKTYRLTSFEAGLYSIGPFLCGAAGNWFAGWAIDRIYRTGRWTASRQWPAMAGFVLAGVGVLGCSIAETPVSSVAWLGLAVFGADIGRKQAGMVSGSMNMAGNLGSFLTGLAFPYLLAWTGKPTAFFYLAATLNILACLAWQRLNPQRPVETKS
jgi:MFS transporter, ACS family, glucarate transporter